MDCPIELTTADSPVSSEAPSQAPTQLLSQPCKEYVRPTLSWFARRVPPVPEARQPTANGSERQDSGKLSGTEQSNADQADPRVDR